MKKNLDVFIGSYTQKEAHVNGTGKGIYWFKLDTDSFNVKEEHYFDGIINPSYLYVDSDKKLLYSVEETSENGMVHSFRIDNNNMKLNHLSSRSTDGASPCHLSFDNKHKLLMVANYSGGNIKLFPVNDNGIILESIYEYKYTGNSINKERQNESHPHSIISVPDNKHFLVQDLGTDKIWIHDFDKLENNSELKSINIHPGSGPRHLAFNRKLSVCYLINELNANINVISFNNHFDNINVIQTLPSLNPDIAVNRKLSAAIHLHPNGKYLYVSNRGSDTISIFYVNNKNGKLTFVDMVSVDGKEPRDFNISPDGQLLICANQNSNDITIFNVNSETGLLKYTKKRIKINSPTFVHIN
ncbi:MAG TPA: lactonase family protein [Victivallales bacterium]|nr:lactonase family protein [Victivallales bacterium]